MPDHEVVHLFLPHDCVIDVHDDNGRMIHNFGELTEQHDGSFVLSIKPSDFGLRVVGEDCSCSCPICGR